MYHEGCGKATKVDENVAKWTKICRSTVHISKIGKVQIVYIIHENIFMKSAYISIQSPLENGKKRQENNSQISLECELTNCHNASAGLR